MLITTSPDVAIPPRRFVPEDFDPADRSQLDEQVRRLMERPLDGAEALASWLYDCSELECQVWAVRTRRFVGMNRNTADQELSKAHETYGREIVPAYQSAEDKLIRRYLDCPHRSELSDEFAMLDRVAVRSAELFREENTTLQAKDHELSSRYAQLKGKLTIAFRGEQLTSERCGVHLESPERATREEAFMALERSQLEQRDTIDELFDEMLALRHQMAVNAGFANFRDFCHADRMRFDYTIQDCETLHEAVERQVLPMVRRLAAQRAQRLGLSTVRPWDQRVSILSSQNPTLFGSEDELVALCSKAFGAVDPIFAGDFDVLVRNGLLDLMSRPDKAPGGYNATILDIRLPFIFFNAAGLVHDLLVLLHEGGHAFHSLMCREIPLLANVSAPPEMAEVASMSMEFFGLTRLAEVLDPETTREAVFRRLERVPVGLASIASIDAFQHWIYTNPGHARKDRRDKWTELQERFGYGADWSGLEEFRASSWQRIPHLFQSPFYYIEYAIAEIGALQLWLKERRDHDEAIAAYRGALALGGSRPIPELFAAAGIRFAMDEAILGELMPPVMAELETLLDSAS